MTAPIIAHWEPVLQHAITCFTLLALALSRRTVVVREERGEDE